MNLGEHEPVELSAQNIHDEMGSLVQFLCSVKLEKRLEVNLTDGNWLKWLNTESSIPLYRAALNVKSDIWPMRSGKKRNAFLLSAIHIYIIYSKYCWTGMWTRDISLVRVILFYTIWILQNMPAENFEFWKQLFCYYLFSISCILVQIWRTLL